MKIGTPESWHQNWKDRSGPCSECDICAKARPQGGAINFDADMALVNNTPRNNRENDIRVELKERTGDEPETYRDGYEEYDIPDDVDNPYSWLHQHRWGALDDLKNHIFEHEKMNLDIEDVYYTNSLKCPKTGDESRDDQARRKCSEYLRAELLDIVDVDVVLVGGPEALQSVFYALNIDIKISESHARMVDSAGEHGGHTDMLHGAYNESPVVVPTYQFSRLQSNWYHPDWISSNPNDRQNSDYFDELVRRITHHL